MDGSPYFTVPSTFLALFMDGLAAEAACEPVGPVASLNSSLLLLVISNFCSIFGEVDKKEIIYETFHLLYSI